MSDVINPYAAPKADDAPAMPVDGPLELNYATKGTRFLNFIIDYVVRLLLAMALGAGLALAGLPVTNGGLNYLFAFLTVLLYYMAFEGIFGFTVGKLITGTRVVDSEGGPPSFGQIVGRSFARLVPFEQFSFFDNPPVGWHDRWSGTRVVNIRR
jgi:uncharacterized RDD family membrane protein YckC